MKILNIRALDGPNYWSISRHTLIVMQLDLEELRSRPTNQIPGFATRIETLLPSMINHFCSENKPGGFFARVREGTWMGHVIEHIALELQSLAGMDCGFGRTRSTGKEGIYNVVFNYKIAEAGMYAAQAAVAIAEALVQNEYYNIEKDINELKALKARLSLGPSTQSIAEEARRRRIPFSRINNNSTLLLGYGKNQKKIQATITSTTSSIAVDWACDKEITKTNLRRMGIPVCNGTIVHNLTELKQAVENIDYPIVIKPNNGNQGKGATVNIRSWPQAVTAFDHAVTYSANVLVEKYISGYDHRMLVINHKFIAAAKRTPACITGDGTSTISELIDEVNKNPDRGEKHESSLTKIRTDEALLKLITKSGFTLSSIPHKGEVVYLRTTANLSTGGTSENVTDQVHPFNARMAERISRIIGLDICGIDLITNDIAKPLSDEQGAILEVNAAPGFRMHLAPSLGTPINVAAPVLDMLFPEKNSSRIPIIAVTGTNGKTTTTRLIAHIAKKAGHHVGYTTSDGVYVQDEMIFKGDCTGPKSTKMVLDDPLVDFAVLECARGGIIKSGLAFDQCDIGIVTNVTADHLGLHDIHTLKELALVKSVIPESVQPKGYAILNADDDLTYRMSRYVKAGIAYFSMDKRNPRLIKHCGNGGFAAYYDDGSIFIRRGKSKRKVLQVNEVPLTYSGKATFMIENVLPAVIACYLSNFSLGTIREGLKSFIPGPEFTPGRMNLFEFKTFDLLVDYAHNPAGFKAIGRFLKNVNAHPKVGVIAGVGDRRDEDIFEVGFTAARIFDEIIIRNDKTLRGRQADEINNLLLSGIRKARPELVPEIIATEEEAIKYIIKNAKKGSFIVFCTELVSYSLALIEKYKNEESKLVLIDEAD